MHKIIFLDTCAVDHKISVPRPGFAHEWVEYEYTDSNQLVERACDATIAITCGAPLRAAELAQLPRLEMICVAMTGTDHVDLDYCREHNILVSNVPAYSPATVAEHALGLLLALRRKIVAYHNLLDGDEWYDANGQTSVFLQHEIHDIHASRIGIVGTGMIGRAMGRLTAGLGMDVVYYNPLETDASLPLVDFDEMLASCDAISIHCPLTEGTRNMFRLAEMQRMKPNAVLVNAARGGIVNEADLIEALSSGILAGAALDAVEYEPIRPDEPLRALLKQPNFVMTPHVAWSSQQAMQGLMDRAIENINQFANKTPINVV